jgi:hypothetical protein
MILSRKIPIPSSQLFYSGGKLSPPHLTFKMASSSGQKNWKPNDDALLDQFIAVTGENNLLSCRF